MLPDHERFRLYFGPYEQPQYEYGDVVTCAARGKMKIIRQADALIPSPVETPIGKGRQERGTSDQIAGLAEVGPKCRLRHVQLQTARMLLKLDGDGR